MAYTHPDARVARTRWQLDAEGLELHVGGGARLQLGDHPISATLRGLDISERPLASGFIFEVKEPAKPGYVVQGVEAPTATGATQAAAEEPLPDWGTVLPKASVSDGKSISTRCEQCHDLSKGGPNKIGPNLWGVVGRPRASHPGFDYSAAMKAKGGSWSYDELFKFLKSPGAYIPGTKMSFAGLPRGAERADVIAFLNTKSDTPVQLPKAADAGGQKAAEAPAGQKKSPPDVAWRRQRHSGDGPRSGARDHARGPHCDRRRDRQRCERQKRVRAR